MSDDWKVGDLAVCVDDGAAQSGINPPPLVVGAIYTVTEVHPDGRGLSLAETSPPPPYFDFRATLFRKIRPDAHEGEREDWNLLLDSVKREKVL